MVVFGVDAHKATHTVVALNQVGQELANRTVAADSGGHRDLLTWAHQVADGQPLRWEVEDCRHVSGLLERDLLQQGQSVTRVPTKMMAAHRRRGRRPGKSDLIDARAAAQALLREPDLPRAGVTSATQAAEEVKVLVDHRDELVVARTALINRIRWHLHAIDPHLGGRVLDLTRPAAVESLRRRLRQAPSSARVDVCSEQLAELRHANARIRQWSQRIAELDVVATSPLQSVLGCGPLTAAKIVGEVADITRFSSVEAFGMHTAAAPIPVASGNTTHVRLARGGNRQLNRALHTIALTQRRLPGPGQDLYQAARDRGKTPREAMRILKRNLARHLYRTLTKSSQAAANTTAA